MYGLATGTHIKPSESLTWVLTLIFSNNPAMPPRLWSKWWPSLRGFAIVLCGYQCLSRRVSSRLRRTFKIFSYSFAWTLWTFSVAVIYSSRYPTACFQACRRSASKVEVYERSEKIASNPSHLLTSVGSPVGIASSLRALDAEACRWGTVILPAKPTFWPDMVEYCLFIVLVCLRRILWIPAEWMSQKTAPWWDSYSCSELEGARLTSGLGRTLDLV